MTSLVELNRSAYQYAAFVQPKFNEICKPLLHLGISYFCYFKLFKESTYFLLNNNNLNYIETIFRDIKDNGDFLTHEFELTTNKYKHFLISGDINRFNISQDPIIHLLYDSNIWNFFGIHKLSSDGYMSFYAFATTRNYVIDHDFYMSKLSLLEHFINYFHEKAEEIIDTTDKRRCAHSEQKFIFCHKSQEDKNIEAITRFMQETQLSKMRIKDNIRRDVLLSKREAQCLEYLSLGQSTKEIAANLDLSPRTVESYLVKIKQKTGFFSRSKLVTEFIKNVPTISFNRPMQL